MTHKAIIKDIQKKQYAPIYFLTGDEPYYIDFISNYIEKNVLSDSEKAFNMQILYGKEIEFKQVVDAARQFPMMASHRVVIIREAQYMRNIENLESYVNNPSPQTLLVICYKHKKLDGRKTFGKLVKAKTVYFESKAIRDYQLQGWIESELDSRGYKIQRDSSLLLAEYLGTDLSKVIKEIDKLVIDHDKELPITKDEIQARIGISKEYNIFELQKAIGERNISKINKIVNSFTSNIKKHPIQMIHGVLYSYFSKLFVASTYRNLSDGELSKKMKMGNSYFLKEYRAASKQYTPHQIKSIFRILNHSDGRSKGISNKSTSESELLKELIIKILSAA